MTLSSPEQPITGFQVWEPAEVTGPRAQDRFVPDTADRPAPKPTVSALFEVSPTAGIPDAVLNPARLAAQSAGYVAGWHRGREAGQLAVEAEAALIRAADERQAQAVREQIARAIGTLHEAAQGLDRRNGPSAEETEELILSASFQLAEAIVGVSLADDQLRGRAALQRALAATPKDVPVTVRLNPQDLAVLETAGLRLDESVSVVADPTLAPGDAYATTAGTRIDARISAALERARGVLRGDLA